MATELEAKHPTTSEFYEPNDAATPSTASRVKPVPVENAFPTPPRREGTGASQPHQNHSPTGSRLFGSDRPSPGPKEHKSLEALRAFSRGGYSSGRSSAMGFDQPTRKEVSQRKSQLFDQAFAARDSYYSAKERVGRDALIVVELKTNCGVSAPSDAMNPLTHEQLEQEKSFLNDFQQLLSETYYKPCQNITISVNTEHHIMMSTSQDPAYLMTVTALGPEIASMKNLRTTKMVQEFLLDNLQIPINRGVIIFNCIKEEDFSTNGATLEDEIARLEAEEKRGMNTRSRQSTRNKRGSTLTGSAEATHVEKSKADANLPSSSDDFGDEEFALDKSVRSASNAGRKLTGKKSFIMSLWKKN